MRHFRYFVVSRRQQNEVDDFSKSTSRLKSRNRDSSNLSIDVCLLVICWLFQHDVFLLLAPPVPGQPSRNGRDAPPPPPPPYRTHGTTSDVPSRGKPPPPPSRTPAGPPPPPPPIRNGHTSISRSFVGESFKPTLTPHLPLHPHFIILRSYREGDVFSKFKLWRCAHIIGQEMLPSCELQKHSHNGPSLFLGSGIVQNKSAPVKLVINLKIFIFIFI